MTAQGEADRGAEMRASANREIGVPEGATYWGAEALNRRECLTAKEEAGPSPIRASRVSAQNDNEKQKAYNGKRPKKDPPLTPKGGAPANDTAKATAQ